MEQKFNEVQVGTKAVWAGEKEVLVHGATQVPVVVSVAYNYDDMDHWYDVAVGKAPGHIYGRNTNPTVQAFEEKVRVLEGAEAATSFSTGMAAISNTLYTFLRPGDRIVSIKDTYGGTNKIFTEFLPQMGIEAVLCTTGDHEEIEAEVAKGCKILYLESPTNPTVKITDIKRMAKAGKEVGALVVVDNTFATPINQNPLQLGADLVIHSATKFLGGHADALGGVVCGSKELVQKIYHYREINGATMDPWAAYLILRGMKTLKLRVKQQEKNAMSLARWLQKQELVESVYYPGLTDHVHHEIAKKQMRGFGGMLSFALKGGMDAVRILLPRLKYANRAANLGAVETTYGPARTTSHVECTPEERAAMGIPDGLVRISAGIEETEDLIADLEQAFKYLESHFQPSSVE
ncbi:MULTISPECIES: cystathionine gamma-synthase family protein [unclassified Thermoactinomyces]|jgi:cystathionine gamma-synthase|uniref:cystathionine gamma-synthase family protein n=1 Tax=unclassified Thermoactinomyces TaxID=2634588 RepID=UPI0018DB05F0|nr:MULTISPECIES: cystathionine gamma-synthase family protein [unclassified Thermoactinomyces]MBH8596497.1 cystathionine gamma-synthase family protein [Thermoactinomyces sp. CICC 10523]MBH8608688.1 cystathionine gamma-synthase family protein [Thermoactinomyces sp. CICC 10521]